MSPVHLDTHVAVWMHVDPHRVRPALRHLEGRALAISPMALLELQYLAEIGRLAVPAASLLAALHERAGLTVAEGAWGQVVHTALALSWTRDPFDRLIAAHALTANATLVTANENLRAHCANAVWD